MLEKNFMLPFLKRLVQSFVNGPNITYTNRNSIEPV